VRFDLLFKGGSVVDPASQVDGRFDVAVARGKIAAVDRDIPAEAAARVVDARGRYVTPGLIDLHTHIFPGSTFWGVEALSIGARTGVTTWVDAGSAGAFTIDGFRRFIVDPSPLRMYAFLNISAIGLVAHDYETSNLALCDPNLFEIVAEGNRDLVVGGKVRLSTQTVGATGYQSLLNALEATGRSGLPLMVHLGQSPPEPDEFGTYIRPGDVVTHCFTGLGKRLFDANGRLRRFAHEWLERGVLLDVGHGGGSFSFEVAEKAVEQGILPTFISSDIHQLSLHGPAYDLPTTLSKMMLLGMTMSEVIGCATHRPAQFMGMEREIGTLRVGANADVALFALEQRATVLYDGSWQSRQANAVLRNTGTYVAGEKIIGRADVADPLYLSWKRGGKDAELFAQQARARPRA
jgi:dihydroorotase